MTVSCKTFKKRLKSESWLGVLLIFDWYACVFLCVGIWAVPPLQRRLLIVIFSVCFFFFLFPQTLLGPYRRPSLEQQSDEWRGRLVVLTRAPGSLLQGRVPGKSLWFRNRARHTGHRGLRLRVSLRRHQSAPERRPVHLSGRLQTGVRRQILHM